MATPFVELSTVSAQETESSPTPSGGQPAAGQGGETGDAATDETSVAAAGESAGGSQKAPKRSKDGGDSADSPTVLTRLVDAYGISADEVATLEQIHTLERRLSKELDALAARLERFNKREAFFTTASQALEEQLDAQDLPEAARVALATKAATLRAKVETSRALVAGISEPIERKRQLLELLAERAEDLTRQADQAAARAAENEVRLEQAEAAEKAALEEAERARARESKERDEQVRKLIADRRAVLEQTARIAGRQSEQIQEASAERTARIEQFAKSREEIEAKLNEFPSAPSESYARSEINPVFEKVLQRRQEVRESFRVHQEEFDGAQERLERARESLEQAREDLEEARDGLDDLGETVVGQQKVELARARVNLHKRQVEAARDIAAARQKTLALDREQLQFYNEMVERLLPLISERARDEFYSVFSDENWRSAWFGVRQAVSQTLEIFETRAQQFFSLPEQLGSVSLWGWIIGLMWRLGLIGVVIFVGSNYTDPTVRRLTHWLLRRRVFQRHAALTIKAAEILRSVVRPLMLYIVLDMFVAYVVEAFPELVFFHWIIDAGFIYWVLMTLVKVLVLPRRFREESLRTPAPDLARLGANTPHASLSAVDLISLELSRARKLVRSIRIVLAFWLLQHYVPMAVIALLGHSVITWLVTTIFAWALIIVVYMVLSTWKDDIAALFERLAKDRIPRAVEFVKNHKDRFYGVLVIAVAFVYVAFREIGAFATLQAQDTEWSKRLSNFVFRKRIEMQQRERNGPSSGAEESVELPDDYLSFFEQAPVDRAEYKVPRDEVVEQVVGDWRAFLGGRPQGSLAIAGEQGVGKTSLLFDVARSLRNDAEQVDVHRTEMAEKVVGEADVLGFAADLFGLDETPETRAELVAQVRELPRRILLIDDCHHFFMRAIAGFNGLDVFLEIVNLTDDIHYWVLTFNKYAWNYINRVRPRKHYFGKVLEVRPWSEREIQELVQRRNALAGEQISFTDLVVTHGEGEDDFYEIIKTANGYFRLLHEFSGGNPMVALRFWKRSVKPDGQGTLQVSLFRKPSMQPIQQLSDNYLFALAAIAQHGGLDAEELAEIINSDAAFSEMALNYFEERDIVRLDPHTRRASLSPLYYRQVVKQLAVSNFLWD